MENITESEHEESSTDDLQRKIAALHTCNFIHTVKGFASLYFWWNFPVNLFSSGLSFAGKFVCL